MSFDSDDSDINFIPEVEIEQARQCAAVQEEHNSSRDKDNLFADEPLADIVSRGGLVRKPGEHQRERLLFDFIKIT